VYREPPVLVSIEQDGPADRAGLLQGDTLTRIDGFPIISAEAGDRIGDVQPGRAMTWTVRRNGELRSVTIVPEPERPRRVSRPRRSEWTVGGVKVEAVGRDVSVTRGAGGALTIRGDSITVIVRPPNGP
jgi:predicted metalloprotease with PDZ domain